ncbi:MAG: hypothetical protein GF368_02625 [Candidatus Aenigmarchaeota archaeon]|nr:hypothetical protein [Candidatus Aenigmarchaeota archaeon]
MRNYAQRLAKLRGLTSDQIMDALGRYGSTERQYLYMERAGYDPVVLEPDMRVSDGAQALGGDFHILGVRNPDWIYSVTLAMNLPERRDWTGEKPAEVLLPGETHNPDFGYLYGVSTAATTRVPCELCNNEGNIRAFEELVFEIDRDRGWVPWR